VAETGSVWSAPAVVVAGSRSLRGGSSSDRRRSAPSAECGCHRHWPLRRNRGLQIRVEVMADGRDTREVDLAAIHGVGDDDLDRPAEALELTADARGCGVRRRRDEDGPARGSDI
jgi:hypothetical protein